MFCGKVYRAHQRRGKALVYNFPQQPMTELTDVLKKGYEAAEKCHICLKEFHNPENRHVRDHCHQKGLYRGAQRLQLKIPNTRPHSRCFSQVKLI